jgi:glycosyltransferase involved in cell wall biosynthesis
MSESNRSLSVIIATRNAESTLENCLRSVLAQSHPDIEIIIVDGGSTDKTLSIVASFAATRSLIKWVSESDRGVGDAQWKGVVRATGDWIYFLGADDYIASPQAIERIFRASADHLSQADILTGHVLYEDGRLYKSNRPWFLKVKNCIHSQGALFKRSALLKRPFDANYRVYYDYDFNLWAYLNGRHFFHTDVLIGILGCNGLSDRPKWKHYREDMQVRRRHIGMIAGLVTAAFSIARYLRKVLRYRLLGH